MTIDAMEFYLLRENIFASIVMCLFRQLSFWDSQIYEILENLFSKLDVWEVTYRWRVILAIFGKNVDWYCV